MRYAWMMRRKGKPLEGLSGIGYGSLPYACQVPDDRSHGRGHEPKIARGMHFDGFNPSRNLRSQSAEGVGALARFIGQSAKGP